MSEGGVCIVKRRWRVEGVAWLLFASKALAPVFFLARVRSGSAPPLPLCWMWAPPRPRYVCVLCKATPTEKKT